MRPNHERAARQRQTGAALALLGPASLLMLLTLITPLALLFRASLNRFDPTELMISAVTPENYLRFFADPFYWVCWSPPFGSPSSSPWCA